MPMRIVQVGELVLRQRANAVTAADIKGREIQNLIAAMRETMLKAPGVGLAAPQIGLSAQIAVIEDKAEYTKDVPADVLAERERKPIPFHVIMNPVLAIEKDDTREFYEGCLSLPGFTAVVPRAGRVRVDCLDHQGESKTIHASGWYARILQHEIDHLHGRLYIDRMHARTFSNIDNFNAVSKDRTTAQLKSLFEEK